jgi:hypothetical protein
MEAGLQTGDRFAYLSKNSLKYCVVEDVLFTHLPRNATGKVLKRVLREPYWEGHGQRVAGVSLLGTKINPPQRGERRVAFVQEHETPGSNGQQVEDGYPNILSVRLPNVSNNLLKTVSRDTAAQIFMGGAHLYGFTDAEFAKADAAAAKNEIAEPVGD